jgi:hypothetical protein
MKDTIKDIALAVFIGLMLAGLWLHWFDVLFY